MWLISLGRSCLGSYGDRCDLEIQQRHIIVLLSPNANIYDYIFSFKKNWTHEYEFYCC